MKGVSAKGCFASSTLIIITLLYLSVSSDHYLKKHR